MIRRLIIMLGIVALAAISAPAQQKQETGLSSWLRELQKKIDVIAPRKSLTVTTGVAGVRGAKDDSGRSKLYWKGKKGEEPVTEEELAEFREGLAYAAAGKRDEAVHEFEEFMKQYPDSALVPDAKKSLDLVKAEQQEVRKEEKAENVEKAVQK